MMIADQAVLERAGKEPRPRNRRLPRGEVHIFDNWCKGCGLCIEFCPQGVLVLGTDNRPKAIYPEKCTACRWCELHCPDFAIFVSDLDASGNDADTKAVGTDAEQLSSPLLDSVELAIPQPESEDR
jgi:2-oxoglutarate ferredoxin oxidoreductase subunit delta